MDKKLILLTFLKKICILLELYGVSILENLGDIKYHQNYYLIFFMKLNHH